MPLSPADTVKLNFLKHKWRAEEERQKEAQDKLDLYKDDYEEIIRDKMSKLFHPDNYSRLYYHVNQSQNILKRVINEISTIYKMEPQREYGKNERYSEIQEQLDINTKMKKVNRYTNLLNECIIKVGVREDQLTYDILTPNISMVVQNEDDPTKMDAFIYQTTLINTQGDDEIKYHYWDVWGDYYIFDKEFKLIEMIYDPEEGTPSPYFDKKAKKFIIPFVVFHRQDPDNAFWDQDTGRDLYNAAVMIGIKMTMFDYYFKVSSFKQPYIVGEDINVPAKQVLDPLTVFQASGEGAQIGLLDMQINMDQLKEALIFQINSVINNYGISADMWSLAVNEMSGRALKIRNMALLEIREDQLPLYRRAESDLFNITRIVNNAHFKKKIPENIDFSIDFGEIDFPEDPEDELRLDAKRLKMGILSPGQFYQKYNPDVKDEKEAEKLLLQNLDKLAKTREEHPSLEEALNTVLGRGGFMEPQEEESKEEDEEDEKE